jgi:hypothetical protein
VDQGRLVGWCVHFDGGLFTVNESTSACCACGVMRD